MTPQTCCDLGVRIGWFVQEFCAILAIAQTVLSVNSLKCLDNLVAPEIRFGVLLAELVRGSDGGSNGLTP